jgi:hypothetical protein
MLNKPKKKSKHQPKITLHPLAYTDAVSALMQVKPEPKKTKKK